MNTPLIRLLLGLLVVPLCICQLSAQPDPKMPPITPSTDPKDKDKDEDPIVKEARDLYVKGEVDKAYKKLEEAWNKTKTLPPPRLMLARLVLQTPNQGQAGRQLLEIAFRENPGHPECFLTNASIALAEGRITDTILNCSVALNGAEATQWTQTQRKTFKREANAGLATAYEAQQAWAAARKHLSDWADLEPDNAQVLQRLARAMFLTDEKDADVLAVLAKAAKVAKPDALTKTEVTIDPPEVTMGQFYAGRASSGGTTETEVKKAKADHDAAKNWFEEAIKMNTGKKARPYQAYAGWLLDNRKLKEAKEQIDLAAAIDKSGRETIALQGLYSRYIKDFPKAEGLFQDLVVRSPNDFFSSNQLALVLIETGKAADQERGVSYAVSNAERYRQSAEAMATLGWAYFKTGKFAEAERALSLATSSGQASADTAFYLAKLLMHKLKDIKEDKDKKDVVKRAIEVLDQAVKSRGVFVNYDEAVAYLDELKKHSLAPPPEDKKKEGTTDPKDPKKNM